VCPHAQIQRVEPLENSKIRCILAHDHLLLRQGLRRLLEDEPDMAVVAEATNASEALEMVLEHRPDIVVTDAGLFGLPADQVERLILHESPQSRVLFLSMSESDEPSHEGPGERTHCAVRQTSAEELAEMLRNAVSAEAVVLGEMPRKDQGQPPTVELMPRKPALTAREHEVLKLLAEGRTVRSAAGILGLSVKTVDAHKFNLMRKLAIHNKAELVMWAIQKKVVKPPAKF